MVDETRDQLLSRFVDGDLEPVEARRLEETMRADPELRRRVAGLEEIRHALRALADREQPPRALDSIVEPLLQGDPASAGSLSWWRPAASAAAVVVLAAVSIWRFGAPSEPSRSLSGWQERATADVSTERGDRFSLAPLPSATSDGEERSHGAVDRLLAGNEPEIETPGEIEPLEVMGPLPVEYRSQRRTPGVMATAEGTASRPVTESQRSSAGPGSDGSPEAERRGPLDGQLMVFMGEATAWRSFRPDSGCEPGRYALRVRIEDGMVAEVWPVWKPVTAPQGALQAAERLLGLAVDGVPPGEYPAEVVIEPRPEAR